MVTVSSMVHEQNTPYCCGEEAKNDSNDSNWKILREKKMDKIESWDRFSLFYWNDKVQVVEAPPQIPSFECIKQNKLERICTERIIYKS